MPVLDSISPGPLRWEFDLGLSDAPVHVFVRDDGQQRTGQDAAAYMLGNTRLRVPALGLDLAPQQLSLTGFGNPLELVVRARLNGPLHYHRLAVDAEADLPDDATPEAQLRAELAEISQHLATIMGERDTARNATARAELQVAELLNRVRTLEGENARLVAERDERLAADRLAAERATAPPPHLGRVTGVVSADVSRFNELLDSAARLVAANQDAAATAAPTPNTGAPTAPLLRRSPNGLPWAYVRSDGRIVTADANAPTPNLPRLGEIVGLSPRQPDDPGLARFVEIRSESSTGLGREFHSRAQLAPGEQARLRDAGLEAPRTPARVEAQGAARATMGPAPYRLPGLDELTSRLLHERETRPFQFGRNYADRPLMPTNPAPFMQNIAGDTPPRATTDRVDPVVEAAPSPAPRTARPRRTPTDRRTRQRRQTAAQRANANNS